MDEQKKLTISLSETEHRKLKILAATRGESIKSLILAGLDLAFPHWRDDQTEVEKHGSADSK